MSQRTPLYPNHLAAQAKIVDFGGWDMPLHYGSQVNEHHQTRRDASIFDVSHMTLVDLAGEQAQAYLRHLLANDVAKLKIPGKALYSCMLNAQGGVIDDLITYFFSPTEYRLVVNASTRDKDLAWLREQAEGFQVALNERTDLAMIAVQGPQACAKAAPNLPANLRQPALDLKPFHAVRDGEWMVARTGYTGEDGFEILLPGDQAPALWDACVAAGIQPAGLGARDTLRLEAGMALYGHEMDEQTSPDAAGLTWTVTWKPESRDFIGRQALANARETGPGARQIGLVLATKGVLREGYAVLVDGASVGVITSGTFSPTVEKSIALARVSAPLQVGDTVEVEVRAKRLPATVVKPPFVRAGQILV